MNKEQIRTPTWWQIGLILATIAAAITKVYIGIDHDETYVTVMGIRLLNGDRMFDTMWELHMTSAWPAGFMTAFFVRLTGGLEGLVIFLRWTSVLLQLFVAGFFFLVMRKYYRKESVFVASAVIANFLPRGTQNLEYGLLELLFLVMCCVLLYDAGKRSNQQMRIACIEMGFAAVFYAAAVLAYPTVLISLPILLAVLWASVKKECGRWRLPLFFVLVCAILAGLFLAFVFSYLPLAQFLENLRGILSDGMHANVPKAATYGTQLFALAKRAAVFLIAAGGLFLLFRRWAKERILLWYYMLAVSALILIGFNVTGIRPSGPMGLQVRYLIAAVSSLVFFLQGKMRCRKKEEKRDGLMGGLFLAMGIGVYLGTMYGSNMGVEENASFLYLCLFGGMVLGMERAEALKPHAGRIAKGCMVLFALSVIFTRGYLVRITGTGPANITESRVCIESGILRGIYVYPKEAERMAELEREIKAYSDASDTILYLGDEALCNTFAEGRFTSATCISTPIYNEEWVMYYENESHPQPDVIFVDRNTVGSWEEFAKTEFGAYLTERYEIEKEGLIEEKAFYIIKDEIRN
ncbi:MAG: hypothetical protein PUB98_07290 [Clostridiales bacterium]|nr:hypothetical protein [Clostridiales bacterium]